MNAKVKEAASGHGPWIDHSHMISFITLIVGEGQDKVRTQIIPMIFIIIS